MNWYKKSEEKVSNIVFPESEIEELRQRIKDGKNITTLRFSDELGKYQLGSTYYSPQIDSYLMVSYVKREKDISKYKHNNLLSKENREEFENFYDGNGYDIINLQNVEDL